MQQHDELHDLLTRLAALLDLPLERVCQAFVKGFGEQIMDEAWYASHATPPRDRWWGAPELPIATPPDTRAAGKSGDAS